MKDADCICFLQWALPRLGLRWAGFRRVRRQVCKRLSRRLVALGLEGVLDYRALLGTDPAEWGRFDGLCRVSVSRFFRDRWIWESLAGELLPRLTAQALARGGDRLRAWSAGCASGEEPYTLALLFALAQPPVRCGLEIVATDADPGLLGRARRACYARSSLRELPASWRAAFAPSEDGLCLRAEYHSMVRFQEQDLRRDHPPGPFDLILCRNLAFTYFASSRQAEIARCLLGLLVPGGLLLLGSHESLPDGIPGLEQERPWLYRRATG